MNTAKIGATIDHLGDIKAEIAELKKMEKVAKDILIAAGVTVAEGETFRVTISESVRETLHAATVRGFLTASEIVAATRQTDVTTVRVAARTGTDIEAEAA